MGIESTIQSVDWKKVEPTKWAEEIPQLLRKMIDDPIGAHREETLYHLSNNVSHVGGIWGTTLATVPLLFKFLEADTIDDKEWILKILAVPNFRYPGLSEDIRKIYDIFKANISLLASFINHPDYRIRLSVIHILSKFTLDEDISSNILVELLTQESDETIIPQLLMSLGQLFLDGNNIDDNLKVRTTSILKVYLKSENLLYRCHAALTIMSINGETLSFDTGVILVECVDQLTVYSTFGNELFVQMSNVFDNLNEPERLNLLTTILSRTSSSKFAAWIIKIMLRVYGFSRKTVLESTLQELTILQKTVIQNILDSDIFWQNEENTSISKTYRADLSSRNALEKQLKNSTIISG